MRRSKLAELISRHRLLDKAIESNRTHFLSDWNCENPLMEKLLGPKLFEFASEAPSKASYIYFDEETAILRSIQDLHLKREGLNLSSTNLVAGPGSSSLLSAFSLWLRSSGYTDVYYLPPLYYTFHYLLEILDISVKPVTKQHAFEPDCSLDLPSKRAVLLLCDPIWYAGKPISAEQVRGIADWQRATGSLVFVDGSFQYMKWDGTQSENTSLLDPGLTFRLVCPAKALAIPLFRFAYLIHPAEVHSDLLFLYESIVGGASVSDLAFADRSLQVLADENASCLLPRFLRRTYHSLVASKLIRTTITPECGYFAFGVPAATLPGQVLMDQSYFELQGYPDYCRVNLMTACRSYGLSVDDLESA